MSDYQSDPKQENAGFTGQGFTGEDGLLEDGEYGQGVGADPLIAGDGPKRKHSAPLVLVLVVGLAIAGLFAMHTVNKVAAGDPDDPRATEIVDEWVGKNESANPDEVIGPLEGDDAQVLEDIRQDFTEYQVPELIRNDPFPPTGTPTEVQSGGGPARADQVARAAKMLSVKMIIMGSSPLANINGRIVKMNGDVEVILKGEGPVTFKVVEITTDTVTVQAPPAEEDEEPFRKTLFLNKRGR